MSGDKIRYMCSPGTEAYQIITSLRDRASEHAKKLRSIKDEFGATGIYDGGGFPLFGFDSHPGKPWVRRGGLYEPGSSKAGKELAERLRGPIYGPDEIVALLGLETAVVGGRWMTPGIDQIGEPEDAVFAIVLSDDWPNPPDSIKGAERIKSSEWWAMVEGVEE